MGKETGMGCGEGERLEGGRQKYWLGKKTGTVMTSLKSGDRD